MSSTGLGDTAVAIGDLNGNGQPDIITSRITTVGGNVYDDAVAVYPGNGDGTFQPPTLYTANTATCPGSDVVAADVNNDGRSDILSPRCGPGVIDVYLNTTGGCTPSTDLLGNPGFESPVLSSSTLPAPISIGNWLPIGSNPSAAPSRTTTNSHCGTYSET